MADTSSAARCGFLEAASHLDHAAVSFHSLNDALTHSILLHSNLPPLITHAARGAVFIIPGGGPPVTHFANHNLQESVASVLKVRVL